MQYNQVIYSQVQPCAAYCHLILPTGKLKVCFYAAYCSYRSSTYSAYSYAVYCQVKGLLVCCLLSGKRSALTGPALTLPTVRPSSYAVYCQVKLYVVFSQIQSFCLLLSGPALALPTDRSSSCAVFCQAKLHVVSSQVQP